MTEPAAERPSASRLQAMRRVRGGLYELREPSSDTRLWNKDLAPTRVEQRTWSTYNMASLWVGLSVCIPTY
ncbi:MAG TPA: hypothetical protein VGP73_22890, partial [Thermoanaerobaculia bacterium]